MRSVENYFQKRSQSENKLLEWARPLSRELIKAKLTGWEPVCPKLKPLLPPAPNPDG